MNYSLAILSIIQWLTLHIKYMKNVRYCPNSKNFFIIYKQEGSTYFWKMDDNLEYFSNILQSFLIEKIIFLYRKIYKFVFKNNNYKEMIWIVTLILFNLRHLN